MGDFDPKIVSDAARNLERLHRRHLLYTLGGVLPFFIWIALIFTATEKTYPLAVAWFLLFAPLAAVCTLARFLTSLDLRTLTCPRCGGRFATTWGKWPTCKHCGLNLGPTATAGKPHHPVGDSLE